MDPPSPHDPPNLRFSFFIFIFIFIYLFIVLGLLRHGLSRTDVIEEPSLIARQPAWRRLSGFPVGKGLSLREALGAGVSASQLFDKRRSEPGSF